MKKIKNYPSYCGILMLLTILLFFKNTYAQFDLKVEAAYLPGIAMKKVIVTFEDQSVWVLSNQGKVYVKRQSDVGFTLYTPTANEVVADLAGFSELEMYFVVKPNSLIQIKAGIRINIPLATGVTTINNIAVVQGKDNQNFDFNYAQQDWLAVATNLDLYSILKGTSVILEAIAYPNAPQDAERNWSITNAGFKGVDFRYKYPSGGLCADADYVFYNSLGTSLYQEILPDKGSYPSKINCTLFDYRLNSRLTNSSNGSYNFWGTDRGLYAKLSADCSQIWMLLLNQVINDMEEVTALSTVYDLRFAMVATNNGLYVMHQPLHFSPNLNFSSGGAGGNTPNFVLHSEVHEKVSAIANEITLSRAPYIGGNYQFIMPCEKVVWLATDLGVKKLSVVLDHSNYTETPIQAFSYSQAPDNQDKNNPLFSLCSSASMQLNAATLLSGNPNVLLHWFKDGAEVAAWVGKDAVTIDQAGVYHAKIDLQCDGGSFVSVPVTVTKAPAPEISFNYPSAINICSGQSVALTTVLKPGYAYRWFKDNLEIAGQTNNSFMASASGSYHVEVSNCAGEFIASDNALVNVMTVSAPVIKPSRPSYCVGDAVTLKVDNPSQYQIKWYLNKTEVVDFVNQEVVAPTVAGKYIAAFLNQSGCAAESLEYELTFNERPTALVSSNATETIYEGDQVILSANQGPGFKYLWNTGAQTADIVATTSGEYWVTVTNPSGCSTLSNKFTLLFSPPASDFGLSVLNAFSPNGDGINDYWEVAGVSNDAACTIKVYNRFGQLVFSGGSINPIWDGRYKGAYVAAGIYYYLITSKSTVKPLTGNLTLIR